MTSPGDKTIVFVFQSIETPKKEDGWTASVTMAPGSTAETPLAISVTDGFSNPVKEATFCFMGARIPIADGYGSILYRDFLKGIHDPAVWLLRRSSEPVPGRLTFR